MLECKIFRNASRWENISPCKCGAKNWSGFHKISGVKNSGKLPDFNPLQKKTPNILIHFQKICGKNVNPIFL